MAMKIIHKFKSLKADSTDGSLIRPSNWNDDHKIELDGAGLLGRLDDTPGDGGSIEIGYGLVAEGNRLDASRPGGIVFHCGTTAPAGTLKANGAEVSRTAYARLFAVIGTTFGAGNGTTTFNLPDYRGAFIRALDDGKGRDPGRTLAAFQDSQNKSHAHAASTNEGGWHNHSAWADANGNHQHGVNIPGDSWSEQNSTVISVSGRQAHTKNVYVVTEWGGNHAHGIGVNASGSHTHVVNIGPEGGAEARPMNFAALVCIQY